MSLLLYVVIVVIIVIVGIILRWAVSNEALTLDHIVRGQLYYFVYGPVKG